MGLLKEIKVLDLSDEKASFCSKLLADMGANVIKVEKPGGDSSRMIGPFWGGSPHPERSLSFFYNNTNKLGITLNLKHNTGRDLFKKLIRKADVVVESFPPGYLDKLDLSFDSLSQINPRLIMASITGFGQTGPRKDYKSCDLVASAFGGQMYVSGTPSAPPVKLFGQQSYYTASLFGAVAILLAVRKRRLTGKGCSIDLSTQEAAASTLDHVMVDYFYDKTIARRQGNVYGNNLFCILPCKDGYIQITILQNWETLLELMASEGKAEDLLEEKWQQQTLREKHFGHIMEVVERWTRNHRRAELFELGQSMRFPWAPVDSPREVLKSPQLAARQFFIQRELPVSGVTLSLPSLPYKFSSFSPPSPKAAPLRGEHTRQILEDLGVRVSRRRIEKLLKDEGDLINPSTNRAILDGIRVLDFTWMLAGPYATRILADFGAEVIKIQSRKRAQGAEQNNTGYFNTWNRNKRSITLNLSHPEARDIVLKLAAISDVVVENFSPRVIANWGLTYARLREVKPDLVMASISAMGQTGPWRDFIGFGPTFHALSGLTATTSCGLVAPISLGHAYGDTIVGLYAALAILAALDHRDTAGEGQYIDLSEYETLCTLLGPTLLEAALEPERGIRGQRCGDDITAAPYGCYRCLGDDKWCVIAVFNEEEWRAFCRVVNQPELRAERFSTLAKRRKNQAELDRVIGLWTINQTAERIVHLLQKAGVAAGQIQNAEDLARDDQLAARHFFGPLKHPVLGRRFSDRSALLCGGQRPRNWKAGPLLGEANRYVLLELLGLPEADIRSYAERGIIG